LFSKKNYDYFENVIIVAPNQDFTPLDLFQDVHWEELKFSTLFLVYFVAIKESKCHTKQLFNGNFCTKIIILLDIYQTCFFYKVVKLLIHYVTSSFWILCKGKLFGCQHQTHDVINKPNIDVMLHSI
jgi:hypothetical protein